MIETYTPEAWPYGLGDLNVTTKTVCISLVPKECFDWYIPFLEDGVSPHLTVTEYAFETRRIYVCDKV
jgi:hypothetical protein